MRARTLGLLVRRGLRASWGPTALLAVVALLTAAVLSAAPRALDRLHSAQLDAEVSGLSAEARDVSLSPGVPLRELIPWDPTAAQEPPWEAVLADLEAVRAAQPQPLRGVLGEPDVVLTSDAVEVKPAPGIDVNAAFVLPRAAPDITAHARLVEGDWPRMTTFGVVHPEGSVQPDWLPAGVTADEVEPVQVAVSRAAAEAIGWELGVVQPRVPPLPPLVLAGVYEPDDPDDDYWSHAYLGADPLLRDDPLLGKVAVMAGTVAGPMVSMLDWTGQGLVLTGWTPVTVTGVRGGEVSTLASQLRAMTSRTYPGAASGMPVRASSGSIALLERVLAQRAGTDAVLGVTAAGPLGAALVVLALGARLVAERRRSALGLLTVRGASPRQRRAVAGAEGLLVGLPAAALGLGAGLLAVPGRVTAVQVLLALAAGLAPAVALAAAASGARARSQRRDLGQGSRRRLWVDVLVLAAAVAGVALLLSRGAVAGGGAGDTGTVDPLVVAVPPLLCLAVALVAARGLPSVARPVERALARGGGLGGFLGAARARRDTAGGVLPAVALVLCVAVAASSSVLRTTVERGIDDAAWARVGADVRVSDIWVTPEHVEAARSLDDVAGVATIGDAGRGTLGENELTIVLVDSAALATVQAGVPGAPEPGLLRELTEGDGPLPVLASAGSGLSPGAVGELSRSESAAGATEVRVVGVVDPLPGMPPARQFVVADSARAAAAFGISYLPGVALVRWSDDVARAADGTADPAASQRLRQAFGDSAVPEEQAEARDRLTGSPSTAALATSSRLALALGGLLAGLVLVLTLLLATPARVRLLAVLRTLGAAPRQARSLAVWETAPWIVVSLLAGAVLAWAVPALVVAAVDLAPLTGGAAPPSLQAQPVVLAGIAGGLLLVAALAAVVAALAGRRTEAAVLRAAEEQ